MHFEEKKYSYTIYHFISIDTQMLIDAYIPAISSEHTLFYYTSPYYGRDACVDSLWMAYESLAASATNKEFLMPAPAALPLGTKVVLQCLALPTSRTQSLQKYETKIVT